MSYIKGQGATLEYKAGGGSFAAIGQIYEMSPWSPEVKTQETSHLDSAAAEYFATLPDNGEIGGSVFYDSTDTAHQAMTALLIAPVLQTWQFTDSAGTTYVVDGWLTGWDTSGYTPDDIARAAFKIRTSGAVVITPSS